MQTIWTKLSWTCKLYETHTNIFLQLLPPNLKYSLSSVKVIVRNQAYLLWIRISPSMGGVSGVSGGGYTEFSPNTGHWMSTPVALKAVPSAWVKSCANRLWMSCITSILLARRLYCVELKPAPTSAPATSQPPLLTVLSKLLDEPAKSHQHKFDSLAFYLEYGHKNIQAP